MTPAAPAAKLQGSFEPNQNRPRSEQQKIVLDICSIEHFTRRLTKNAPQV